MQAFCRAVLRALTKLGSATPAMMAIGAARMARTAARDAAPASTHSETPGISRMTFVVEGDNRIMHQVESQLYKLINVIKVQDLPSSDSVERATIAADSRPVAIWTSRLASWSRWSEDPSPSRAASARRARPRAPG